MPQVPYSGAVSVEANYPATPSIHPNANPEAFGAATAAASARFGVSLEQAADSIFNRAYAMQQMDQEAVAMNAAADATEKTNARLIDYRSQQGLAAKNGYDPFVKDMDAIIAEGSAGIQSDYAKKIYNNQMRYIRTHALSTAGGHAASEFKQYQVGSAEAAANNSLTVIGMNPDSDEVFDQELKHLSGHVKVLGAIEGWDETKITNRYNELTSKAVATRARLIGQNDPKRGQEILDAAAERNLIDGTTAGATAEYLRGRRNQISSRIESANITDGIGGYSGRGETSIDRAAYAIRMIEGSGSYNPPHKYVTKGSYAGQKALGAYGVMQGNLQPWLAEARAAGVELPAKMSEAEFIRDHDAQDKLFNFKWSQIRKRVKSDNEAAVVWFAGEKGLEKYRNNPGEWAAVNDGGSTGSSYIQKFNRFLWEKASAGERKEIAHTRAAELAPDDPEFADIMHDKVETDWNHVQRVRNEELQDKYNLVNSTIMKPGPDGKYPTQIEDPKVQEAFDQLPPEVQIKINKHIADNATKVYAKTPTNQAEYNRWVGAMVNPDATKEDKEAAFDKDFWAMDLPQDQRMTLVKLRNKVFKERKDNPGYAKAVRLLGPMLKDPNLNLSKDDKNLFFGALYRTMEEQMEEGKPLKPDDIRQIGNELLRERALTETGWFGQTSGIFGPGTGPMFKKEVPDNMRKQIVDSYKALHNGAEPNEVDLQNMYSAILYRSTLKGASNE